MDTGTAFELRKTITAKHITAWGLIRYHDDGMELVCVFTDILSASKAREAFTVMAEAEGSSETFFVDELDFFPATL